MTDPDLVSRLRARVAAPALLVPGESLSGLLQDAADALAACKAAAERAIGATAGTVEEAVELLATEHLNLRRELEAARATAQLLAYPGRDAEGNLPPLSSLLDGPDPAPVALPPRPDHPARMMSVRVPAARPGTFAEARAEFLASTATPERDELWRKGVEARTALAADYARTIDAALRTLLPGDRLAVHTDVASLDTLILAPGEAPPLGKPWTVYEAPQDVTARFDPDLKRRGGKHDSEPDDAYKARIRSYFPPLSRPGVDKNAPRGEVKRFAWMEVGGVRFENVEIEQGPLQHEVPFNPADFGIDPKHATPEQAAALLGLDVPDSTMAPKGAQLEVVGGDGETIRALGLPEPINQLRTRRLYSTPPDGPLAPIGDIDLVVLPPAPAPAKPLVSIVLPALRFEDKRITSSRSLSVFCGDREVWTGNGTCELDIRTTVVENQISYAHPLTFDSMMEAKGTIWLQANDEAAALLRTYRNGSIGLVLCFPAAQSTFTALLFDIADGERQPNSEPGWLGFTLALETP